MSAEQPVRTFRAGEALVAVYANARELGAAAAARAAEILNAAIHTRGHARLIAATGNSQIPLVEELLKQPLNWSAVHLFHMDEYIGLSADHPAGFRRWIRTRLADRVHPCRTFYLSGDAPDLEREMERYAKLLETGPIDLAFVGFGENGHIAFNDPHSADFQDPATVKRVALDEACRRQQAGEGHFASLDAVPREALTITCPGLFRAETWVCCVPEARKAEAVRNALEAEISESCPASLVRRHRRAYVYLDPDSASLLRSL